MLKGLYDQVLMVQAILLNIARGHTASHGRQIPLHYEEACPLVICLPASQLQILLQNTHVPYTERLKSSDVEL